MSTLETNLIQPSSGTTLTIGASGDTITIPSGATITNSGTATGFGANTPNFKVSNSGNTSCANNTFVKLSADTETFDSDSAFASDKFTVPSGKGGKYIFTARVYFPNTTSTDYAQVLIYKNGSVVANTSHVHRDYQVHLHCNIESVSASDYFEVYFRHTAGSTKDAQLVEFSGFRLIE
jgi:hypothetical protein|tara:strand:- start:39 stop:572 length:534 start_codon:yes stop_codon:yes gene_type:complete